MALVGPCDDRSPFLTKSGTHLEYIPNCSLRFAEMTGDKPARLVGFFLLNCFIAISVTAVISAGIRFNRYEVHTYAFKEDIAESIAAIAVGYFVYRRWQYPTAKWVWLAGISWLS